MEIFKATFKENISAYQEAKKKAGSGLHECGVSVGRLSAQIGASLPFCNNFRMKKIHLHLQSTNVKNSIPTRRNISTRRSCLLNWRLSYDELLHTEMAFTV